MKIPHYKLLEFQQLYFQRFGVQLSLDEARIEGMKVLTLLKNIYLPIPDSAQETMKNKGTYEYLQQD
jgi:hypothetical protein